MDVYIPLGLFLALISYIARNSTKSQKFVFGFVFLPLLVFSAIRFGFGPDYFSYWDIWSNVRRSDVEGYSGVGSSVEPMFLKFLQLFPKYTWFIVTTSVMLVSSYFFLFKKYVTLQYLWLVVLFLFFNNNCLLGNYVAMRTMICGCLFIVAFHFLVKDDIKSKMLYAIIIFIASRIHSSSIALIVLIFLNTKTDSILYKWYLIVPIGLISAASVFFGNNIVVSWLSSLLMDNIETFERYQDYEIGSVSSSVMAIAFRLFSFTITAYLAYAATKESNKHYIMIYKIAIIAALVQLFLGQSLISDRYLMVLNPFYIIAIVRSFVTLRNVNYKFLVTILVMGISIYLFSVRLSKDYSVTFLHYKTVFSQNIIP